MSLRTILLLGSGLVLSPTFPHQAGAQDLEAVVAAAIENSPSVAAAQARAEAAAAQLDLAEAQRLPDVTAQGQIGVGRIDPQGFFGLSADDVTPRVAQLNAEMPLLTFGRIGGGIDQASGGSEAAELMANQVRLNLRVEVANAYSQAVAARRLVNSYELLRLQLEEVLRQARLKYDAGEGTSTETAQARARLAEAEAGLAQANGSLATAQAQLQTLAGFPVQLDDALPAPPAIPASREEAVADALAANPQLLAAGRMAEAAEGAERAARAEGRPTVGAFAEAASVRDQFFPGYKADSVSAGLRLRWNFLSFGRNSAKARAAGSQAEAAAADHADARLRTQQAAITAWENHQTARLMLTAAEARQAAASEALRGTRLEVEAGAKPQLALLDAQREAIAAEAALSGAQGQVVTSAFMLRAVAGIE